MIATPASSCPAPTARWSPASANCCRTNTAASARCEDSSLSPTPRRLVTAERRDDDDAADGSLRPQRLAEFIGQQQARSNLSVFIEAARARREPLDHVLFVGPPGLGKTTLAQIVARELGVNFRATSGPVIAKAGDLAALLTNLEERDVLFIDEIHRLNPAVEEILYPAMEDFQLDLIIGELPAGSYGASATLPTSSAPSASTAPWPIRPSSSSRSMRPGSTPWIAAISRLSR